MTGKSLIIEIHGFRRPGFSGGPFGRVVVLGWLSVMYVPFLISQWLRTRVNAMKNAIGAKDVPPIAEMSAWDADRSIHKTIPRGRT